MGDIKRFLIGAVLVGAALAFPNLAPLLRTLLISTGIGLASSSLSSGIRSRQSITEHNGADPLRGVPVVYGTARVGLCVVFADVAGTSNKFLYIVGALCHGSSDGQGIQGIDEIYFDNVLAVNAAGTVQSPFTGRVTVTKYLGTDTQNVDAAVNAAFPTAWPTTARLRGVAYIVIRLEFDPDVFAQVPNVTVNVRGCRVFDTRDDTWKFSDNPWLCVRDYLVSPRYGVAAATTEIDEPSFESEANYADELQTIPEPFPGVGTTTEKRYTCNGWLDVNQGHEENVRQLLTSCRGNLVTQGGLFRGFSRRQVTPTTFTLSERNIVGDWSFGIPGVSQKLNQVGYSWIDPADHYQPKSHVFPDPSGSNSYLTADNGYASKRDIELPFSTTPYIGRRIAETEIRESRAALSVQLTAMEDALQLQVGDVVPVSHATPGFVNKPFWVLAVAFDPESTLVRLALSEYDANAYAFDAIGQYIPGAEPGLPSPTTVAAPTSVVLVFDGSDALDSGAKPRLTWVAAADAYLLHYEVEYRKVAAAEWTFAARPNRDDVVTVMPTMDIRIAYEARIRAINTLGIPSAWVTASSVILLGRMFELGKRWTFETDVAYWPLAATPSGVESYPADGQTGGKVYQTTGFRWRVAPASEQVAFDPSKLIRMRCKVRRTSDGGTGLKRFYCGLEGIAADGVTRVNVNGADASGSQHYVCATNEDQEGWSVNAWQEFTGWLRGWGTGAVSGVASDDPRAPAEMHPNVRYVRPLYIANYDGTGQMDTVQVDEIELEEVDEESANRIYGSTDGAGTLSPGTTSSDGANPHAIMRGYQRHLVEHGQNVAFNPPFNSPPQTRVTDGKTFDGTAGNWSPSFSSTAPQYPRKQAENVTALDCDIRAQLYQPGSPTTRTHDFAAVELDVIDEAEGLVLSNAPAVDNVYTVRIHRYIEGNAKHAGQPAQFTLVVAIDTRPDNVSVWTERATAAPLVLVNNTTAVDSVQDVIDVPVSVSGLTNTAEIRVRIKSFTIQGLSLTSDYWARGADNGTYDGRGVTYITRTDNVCTATDAANRAVLEAWL